MTGALAEGDAPVPRLDLTTIQARAEAATPGPWTLEIEGPDYEAGTGSWHTGIYGPENVSFKDGTPEWRESFGHQVSEISEMLEADADFIVHAREDVPALLAALVAERARAGHLAVVIDQLREWRAEWARAGHLDERMRAILDSAPRVGQEASA